MPVITRWDDIIFSKRNKEYGAYHLRKGYAGTMVFSTLAASILFLLPVLWLFHHYNSLNKPRVGHFPKYVLYEPGSYDNIKEMDQLAIASYPSEEEKERPEEEKNNGTERVHNTTPVVVADSLKTDELPVEPTGEGSGAGAGQDYDAEGTRVYDFVEEMPQFPGGEEGLRTYIAKNTNFPEYAWKNKIRGTVYVSFIIDEEGKVVNVEIIKSVHPMLDAEVVRVVSSLPRWKPGSQQGRKVKVRYNLPVNFL
jgi:protein TonB